MLRHYDEHGELVIEGRVRDEAIEASGLTPRTDRPNPIQFPYVWGLYDGAERLSAGTTYLDFEQPL